MSGLHELAEQGRKIRKEEEEKLQAEKLKTDGKKKKSGSPGAFRRSPVLGYLLYLGILGIFWGVMMPVIDDKHSVPETVNYAVLIAGMITIIMTFVINRKIVARTSDWEKSLPFKLPALYQRFLNKEFSHFSKGSGTSYYNIDLEIVFEYPFEAGVVTDAIIGLRHKGIKVETDVESTETTLEELENPVMEVFPPEDDEEYFATPDEPVTETQDAGNADPVVLKITGSHFANGSDFHRFFKRLCEEILIPLHKENKIVSIHLTNDGDMEFYA